MKRSYWWTIRGKSGTMFSKEASWLHLASPFGSTLQTPTYVWWRTAVGDVTQESHLPTDADCENSEMHLKLSFFIRKYLSQDRWVRICATLLLEPLAEHYQHRVFWWQVAYGRDTAVVLEALSRQLMSNTHHVLIPGVSFRIFSSTSEVADFQRPSLATRGAKIPMLTKAATDTYKHLQSPHTLHTITVHFFY
jgi:hypothetical protein